MEELVGRKEREERRREMGSFEGEQLKVKDFPPLGIQEEKEKKIGLVALGIKVAPTLGMDCPSINVKAILKDSSSRRERRRVGNNVPPWERLQ